MAMEIRINATEMLKVLVHAGIETTDAKAIIFDLLQYPEKVEKEKVKEVSNTEIPKRGRPGRPKKVISEPSNETDNSIPDDDVSDTETEDETTDDEEEELPLKRPKRISFKNFGGVAQSVDSILRKSAAHAK